METGCVIYFDRLWYFNIFTFEKDLFTSKGYVRLKNCLKRAVIVYEKIKSGDII